MANSSKDIEGIASSISLGYNVVGVNIVDFDKWHKGTGITFSSGISYPFKKDVSIGTGNTEIIFSTKDQNFIIPLTKEMNNYIITPWYSGFYDMSK
ncbi:hypothetical protein MWG03_04940 [Fusobacterium necrophorum]|uniref:hypothetical protein n=1 Tax=Fusobacterium necrophorum TaxID=859 RepID=UPI00254F2302|nr:hypothetical protein [Fusobacterium necrophorum]MDK4501681.1 hypothetical protein [Fusobacterium necrophorum]